MHQALPDVPKDQYIATMKQMHERISAVAKAIAAAYEQAMRETVSRDVQMMRGSLSQFLHTMLKGDDEEVRRTLGEALEKFRASMSGQVAIGVKDSVEGRVFFPASKKAMEKRLVNAGRNYLNDLGLVTLRGNGDIFESMFVVQGAVNLDILEYIVRDRMGIYADPHGIHIKEFGGYSYTAYNLIYAKGEMPERKEISNYTETGIFFSKPDVKYAPFRNTLVDVLDKLVAAVPLDHITVWQRKLGLGIGKEFVLRMISRSPEQLSNAIQWLSDQKENPGVHEALIRNGKLVVKELLF